MLGLLGWHDIGGHPRSPSTTGWMAQTAPSCLSGCSSPFGFREAGRRRKAKVGSACSTPCSITEVGIFYLLPFAFQQTLGNPSPRAGASGNETRVFCLLPFAFCLLPASLKPKGDEHPERQEGAVWAIHPVVLGERGWPPMSCLPSNPSIQPR